MTQIILCEECGIAFMQTGRKEKYCEIHYKQVYRWLHYSSDQDNLLYEFEEKNGTLKIHRALYTHQNNIKLLIYCENVFAEKYCDIDVESKPFIIDVGNGHSVKIHMRINRTFIDVNSNITLHADVFYDNNPYAKSWFKQLNPNESSKSHLYTIDKSIARRIQSRIKLYQQRKQGMEGTQKT